MSYSKVNTDDDDRTAFLEKVECDACSQIAHQKTRKSWLIPSIALLSVVAHAALLVSWKASGTGELVPVDMPNAPKLSNPFHNFTKTKIENWEEDAWDNSVFVGAPSRELDLAWNKLQAIQGISVTPEESAEVDLQSHIKLKNGDQAVIVGYFHNLHCLRYLYQGLHPEVYERSHLSGHGHVEHSHHCIEVLRRSVLCNPDVTLHAIEWQDEQKLGMNLHPESTRECVDFDALYDFSMTRKFPRNMIVGEDD